MTASFSIQNSAKWMLALILILLCGQAGAEETPKATAGGFAYKQETAAKGTKSAGERGILLFNNQPLHWVGTLKTPIGTFAYFSSDKLWEPQGWFPTDDVHVKDSGLLPTPAELAAGSYKGARRAGTPVNWCYSPEMDTWYAPERLQ